MVIFCGRIIFLVMSVILCSYCIVNIVKNQHRQIKNQKEIDELMTKFSTLMKSDFKYDEIIAMADDKTRTSAIEKRDYEAENWKKSLHQYLTRGTNIGGQSNSREISISRMEDLISMFGIMKNNMIGYVGNSQFEKAKELFEQYRVNANRVKPDDEKRKASLKLKISKIQDKLARKSFQAHHKP